jgi:hypothetical protein
MPQMPRRMFGGNQQGGSRRFARAWILEQGEPALVMFRAGATDGRNTQVLELGSAPNLGRLTSGPNAEQVKRALERKLEPGMHVIVDSQAPKS